MSKQKTQKLTYALIGCGRVSVKHIRAVLKNDSGLQIMAIVDQNPDAPTALLRSVGMSEKKISSFFSHVKVYSDYKTMLEEIHPDIVAITVPSGLHYEIGKATLLSGSHILLEKPMTMRISEAKELSEISEATGRQIAMGHIYRYLPIVGNLQKDIASGVFGKISHGSVIVRWGHDQKYYDQASWRGTWKSDGGSLMNQSIHALDLMCWLMNSMPISASCLLARRTHVMQAEDIATGILKLQNDSLCLIEGTTNTPQYDHEASFYICGTEGTLRVGLRKGKPFFDIRNALGKKKTFSYVQRELREKGLGGLLSLLNPHEAIYKNLVCAITNNTRPIADAISGYKSVETVLALYQSALLGREVSLPLKDDFCSEDMSSFLTET